MAQLLIEQDRRCQEQTIDSSLIFLGCHSSSQQLLIFSSLINVSSPSLDLRGNLLTRGVLHFLATLPITFERNLHTKRRALLWRQIT